jgi:hypothetical protein
MPPQTHTYQVHGLTLASQLPIPDLAPSTRSPQAHIRLGPVPDQLQTPPVKKHVLYDIAEREVIIHLEKIAQARIWVRDGQDITVQLLPDADPKLVREYLLGPALSILLYQRGAYLLHGSAVHSPHGAVLFVGESGAGKSTTAAGFQARGWPLITDDMGLIQVRAGQAWISPGSQRLKLWQDSLTALDLDQTEGERISQNFQKFAIPQPEKLAQQPIPVYAILELNHQANGPLKAQELSGMQKIGVLARNNYTRRILRILGQQGRYLLHNTDLGNAVRIFRVHTTHDFQHLNQYLAELESLLLA